MHQDALTGCNILVVEDDYFVANDIVQLLKSAGATILGPVPSIEASMEILKQQLPTIAILDIKIHDGLSFDVADYLLASSIPFIFFSGYEQKMLPEKYKSAHCLLKPALASDVLRELASAISNAASQQEPTYLAHENSAG
ncbi:hypothetical protein [Methylorubrum populi]